MIWPLLRLGALATAVVAVTQLPVQLHTIMAALLVVALVPLTMRASA